jgi:hypothetical protein
MHIYRLTPELIGVIQEDPDPQNPRADQENLFTWACYHSRYNIGDDVGCDDYEEFRIGLAEDADLSFAAKHPSMGWEESNIAVNKVISRHYIEYPIYMYEHSGVALSSTPFSCRYDSGQVGFAYLSKKAARKEFGILTKKNMAKLHNVFSAEVAEMHAYLSGGAHGYAIYKLPSGDVGHEELNLDTLDEDDLTRLERVDSCWGFYCDHDDSYLINEMRSAAGLPMPGEVK